ncbi:MAG: hypothetical protein KJ077_20565 [Anaerolineae bacterium]|nr:hypothetical protein [Anaerolineae bacterium]
MDKFSAPVGMILYDELLNMLLAIWKAQQGLVSKNESNEFSQGYQIGFEEGLDTIAQVAGLNEIFEVGKAAHRAKIRARLNAKVEIIDSEPIYLDRS